MLAELYVAHDHLDGLGRTLCSGAPGMQPLSTRLPGEESREDLPALRASWAPRAASETGRMDTTPPCHFGHRISFNN